MRRLIFSVVAVGLVSCTQDKADTSPASPSGETAAADETPSPEPQIEEEAFITGTTSLKRIASDEKKIDDPEGKATKKVPNWLATLYRGEQVIITGVEGDWAKVRTTGEKEGWLEKDGLLRATDVTLATSFDTAKVFKRPDLLALDSNTTVEPGNLLFVLKDREQFTQVNFPRSEWSGSDAWMLSESLVKDSSEVAAAKLIMKIRYLRAKKDESAKPLEELARSQFGSSKLIGLLEQAPEQAAEPVPGEGDEPTP